MTNKKDKLILFTRFPIPGDTKTRLIPELGQEGAAKLQEIMTGSTVITARCFSANCGADIEIRYDGGTKADMQSWLGKRIKYKKSGKGDIGRRMDKAFEDAFKAGYERVVIIGCDCPKINTNCLTSAFKLLNDKDMVIGPATDGGYYLIGLKETCPGLFRDIEWGTDSVCEKTLEIADYLNFRSAKVEQLSDVDHPGDLKLCTEFKNTDMTSISVIIATLNEEENIEKTIRAASEGAFEIITADAGSQDNTVQLAKKAGAITFQASLTRAGLFNKAALLSEGDVLLFLHADTILPDGYKKKIMNTVNNFECAAGAFSLGIDAEDTGISFIEKMANLRSRRFNLPYGDQGLFMRKDTFLRTGGFADMPIMEDYELIKRLSRKGKIITLSEKVKTSARRWLQLGVIRTTIINKLMVASFKIGIPPEKLAHFYRSNKKLYQKNHKAKNIGKNSVAAKT